MQPFKSKKRILNAFIQYEHIHLIKCDSKDVYILQKYTHLK